MILKQITKKQKEILILLYRFRFLNTNQIQKLLNHKLPTRIQEWLKDLKDTGYINTNYKRETSSNTRPAVYWLLPKARNILKLEEDYSLKELDKVYKEGTRKEKFISHCLLIAEIYLFFLSKKSKNEDIQFFTKTELAEYEYFPDPLPDAYISVETKRKATRYLLHYFDPYTPAFVLRNRVKNYIQYAQSCKWEESTDTSFPLILFVCPDESLKKHIFHYVKAKLEKEYNSKLSLFLTTKSAIQNDSPDIWQEVES
ncbi:replication-relaxation family protein [Patescibacteria group bacterium]|nr:replication-relaxation family protein [Patescibacteria group bacterium]